MKLQKQRAYRLLDKRWQYKYVITLPETIVDELGWEAGSELEAAKRDKSLVVDFVANPSEVEKRAAVKKMTYEEFCDKIRDILQYNDKGRTWTQIRTQLNPDTAGPNNKRG